MSLLSIPVFDSSELIIASSPIQIHYCLSRSFDKPWRDDIVSLYNVSTIDKLDCWNNKCAASSPNRQNGQLACIDSFQKSSCTRLHIQRGSDSAGSQQWLHNRLWNIRHVRCLISEETIADRRANMSIAGSREVTCRKLYNIVSSVAMLLSCYLSLRKAGIDKCLVVPSDIEILNQYVSLLATFGGGRHFT
ncbi:hypothetical protein V1525DRAFT_273947 [Lipomyces kononenkoae]|uniref:Uncharacterized protein n=1 Tax=Lipomyces kononenkoae TaxID=34357 RepID=A0ACC3SUN9_LIPKO